MRQAPMAPRRSSAGDGASSPPPASAGASITSRCGPTAPSILMPVTHCTVTALPMVSASALPSALPQAVRVMPSRAPESAEPRDHVLAVAQDVVGRLDLRGQARRGADGHRDAGDALPRQPVDLLE